LNQENKPLSAIRWRIVALLFFATTINYIDRQILSLLKPILDEELGWTNEEFGYVNSLFQGAYAIGMLGFGWFIDRFGTKIGYAVSIVAWSLAAAVHALAGTVRAFSFARISLGLGEGGNFPAAIKVVAAWFPKSERAFATTLFNSGANVGAVIAPALIPPLALAYGWQSAFLVAGAAGLLWVVFWWFYFEQPRQHKGAHASEIAFIESGQDAETNTESVSWLSILKYRQAWSFIISKFLTDPVWWFFLIWLPDYFKKSRGLDLKQMSGVFGPLVGIYLTVTVCAILGGYLTNYLASKGFSNTKTRKTSMFIFALLVIPIVFVSDLDLWPAVFLIGIAGGAHQAWSANLFTTVSDMFPKKAVGSVVGIGGMAGALGGMMFPIYSGKLLDQFTGNESAGYAILFTICASAYLLAFAIAHLLAPKFEPIKELQ
jgi:ACS family hexuronate transporter-like MFS transporter